MRLTNRLRQVLARRRLSRLHAEAERLNTQLRELAPHPPARRIDMSTDLREIMKQLREDRLAAQQPEIGTAPRRHQ